SCFVCHCHLHSFPTRRSSDLILLGLMVIYICGNLCAAVSVNYWMMLMMRFISGLPHGAFFGVGSIVAERVADKGKSSQAVALMRSEEHTSELQSRFDLVCRLL